MGGCATDDDDRTGDICPDGFGNVYAIGFYEDAADFDGTILNALGRKDIFVWKMSMTSMPPFTYNNTFDTIYAADSMVFSPADTGIFTTSGFIIDGCDTAFVDSVVHQKLGVQIIYDINNIGSATMTIDGTLQALPYTQNYWAGETIAVTATLQPNWLFSHWKTYNNNVLPTTNSINATFIANASDSCVLMTYPKPSITAFISGNDTLCVNEDKMGIVQISFSAGVPPYTFVYAHDGQAQIPIPPTSENPYVIESQTDGEYTLVSFSDANEVGWTSGAAYITVVVAPKAVFTNLTDTLSVIYPSVQFSDLSEGAIVDWQWNFGDNTFEEFTAEPFHTFNDSTGIYQVWLIVTDGNGCTDTTYKQIWITDEFWMYIPNSFTPEKDGLNDLFCISYNGVRIQTFHFNIYNRYSDLVYSTDNLADLECLLNENGWDGTHYQTGNDLPIGTYVYEVYFQDFEGWKHQEHGNIYIIR